MNINQRTHLNRRRVPRVGIALAAVAVAAGAVASLGDTVNYSTPAVVASADDTVNYSIPNSRDQSTPAVRDQAASAVERVAFQHTAPVAASRLAADPLPRNRVKARDALLRSQPNRNSTKLDVSQPGRGLDLYCWVPGGPSDGGYIWFKAHPWGSRYTGWMRADLIVWGTYPNPGRC